MTAAVALNLAEAVSQDQVDMKSGFVCCQKMRAARWKLIYGEANASN